jgi:hypothetical protein
VLATLAFPAASATPTRLPERVEPPSGPLQEEVQAALEGQVLRAGEPMQGARVVLHRVSADEAGELDSIPSGPEGGFRFDLPGLPDPGSGGQVYFASVRHQGILYFGPAITRPVQLDSLYTIRIYDTVTAAPGGAVLPIQVRYLILESAPEGWQVTDLFEIRVPEDGTVVAREGDVTWRHPLPAGAVELDDAGQEVALAPDADPGQPRVDGGSVVVGRPLSPGARQFLIRYRVPTLDGLEIPFTVPVDEVELMIREPVPDLTMTGLAPVETVETEPGVTYRRFTGSLSGPTVVAIQSAPEAFRLPLEWTAVALALLLAIAGLYAVRRGAGAHERGPGVADGVHRVHRVGSDLAPTPPDVFGLDEGERVGPERRRLRLLEVARLDEALEAEGVDPAERARLEARRSALLELLRDDGP